MDSGQKIGLRSTIIKKIGEKKQTVLPQQKEEKAPQQKNKIEISSITPKPNPEQNQQNLDNQFYDSECEQAVKSIEKQGRKGSDKKFDKKMGRLSKVMQRLSLSISQLKDHYGDIEIEQLLSKKQDKKKQAQARAFVKSKIEQKSDLLHRLYEAKQREEDKKREAEEAKRREDQASRLSKLEEVKKQIVMRKQQKKKQKQQGKKKQQQVKQYVQKYLKEKPLYQKLQVKHEKRQKKQEQFHQAYLNKRKQRFLPFRQKQFQQHLKLHEQKLKQVDRVKHKQKTQKQQQIMEKNLKILEKIYRGKNYQRIQQQQQQKQRQRQFVMAKIQKIKKYQAYVKENFKPQPKEQEEENEEQQEFSKMNKNNQDDDDDDDQQQDAEQESPKFKKIKRYKFLQGKSCGQIIETIKMPLSERDMRRMGDGYLDQVYNIPKKKKAQPDAQLIQVIPVIPKKRLMQVPRLPRPKNWTVKISQKPNRDELNNLLMQLKSKETLAEMKQKYLNNMAAKGTSDKATQLKQELNDNLISIIQRKLSLLTQL